MKTNNPKSFVLQLGSLITLYISVTSILMLFFGVIDLRYPDEAAPLWESQSSREMIRTSIAMLFVFFPAYIALTRISNQERRRNMEGEYMTITKWLVYLSLLVAGGALLGDLVAIINAFLNGEITIRFVLKAFVFFAVIAGAFTYYLNDVRGVFATKEKLSKQIGMLTVLIVVISIVAGFMYIETPQEVREIRLDEKQVADLQDIQWRFEDYYRVRGGFPESVDDLYVGETMPQSPEGREPYTYVLTGEDSYELCAEFAYESQDMGRYETPVFPVKSENNNWNHGSGYWCFERVVEEPRTQNE